MLLRRLSTAATLPISLAEAKVHLRVDDSAEDALISGFIASAVSIVGEMAGRVMVAETWAASYADLSGAVVLPKSPISGLVSVTYYDAADTLQTAPNSDFYLFQSEDYATLKPKANKDWPSTIERDDAITITFSAGYAALPPELRVAALLMLGHLYSHREAVDEAMQELPMGVEAHVAVHRLKWFEA